MPDKPHKSTKPGKGGKPDKAGKLDKAGKSSIERNQRTIFVGNLPSSYDHREVAKLFKTCGPVESARIRSAVPEKEKLAPKVAVITKRLHPKVDSVNAYVVFEENTDEEAIKKALAMNGRKIDGHHIRVDRANMPNSKRMTLTSRKKSIFVGNMRFDTRDDDLINHFSKVGPVKYVRIVRDKATGLGKGFGFVVFEDRASVKKALELNNTNFKGREIRIKKVDAGEKEEEKGTKKMKKGKKEDEDRAEEDESGSDEDLEEKKPSKVQENGQKDESKKVKHTKKRVTFKSEKNPGQEKHQKAKLKNKPGKLKVQEKKKMLKNRAIKLKNNQKGKGNKPGARKIKKK